LITNSEQEVDSTHDFKSAAHQLIETLPTGATWDDLMYRVYVRQCVDAGLADADANRLIDVDDVRKQFGLQP
jgi:hypothetical protein